MRTLIYYVGYDWREEKIKKYDSEQHAIDSSTHYQVIESSSWKEAREMFREMYTIEPENRDL